MSLPYWISVMFFKYINNINNSPSYSGLGYILSLNHDREKYVFEYTTVVEIGHERRRSECSISRPWYIQTHTSTWSDLN